MKNTGRKMEYIRSLAAVKPELKKEWDQDKNGNLTPEQVTYASAKKVYWLCHKKHSWKAAIYTRTIGGNGCPICSNRVVLTGYNDLAYRYPEIAKQWHTQKNGDLRPEQVVYASTKKVGWLCQYDHDWEAIIYNRTRNKSGCPVCSNRKVISGINDLATLRSDLKKEWHPTKNGDLKPEHVSVGSNKKVWWQCAFGHEWRVAVYHRTGDESGCPVCNNHVIIPGINDLATMRPDLKEEWHLTKNGDLKPEHVTCYSNIKVYWKCVKGHEWLTSVKKRSEGASCPYCRRTHFAKSTNPLVSILWDDERNGPLTDDIKINTKVWFCCPVCAKRWRALIVNVIDGYNMCPDYADHGNHY